MTHSTASLLPLVLIVLVPWIITAWAGWRILVRAGHNGAWSLTLLVPFVNFVMLFVFAFSRWPVEKSTNAADIFD